MTVADDLRAARALIDLHERVVADVPKLKSGRVWCHTCGISRAVDSASALRRGWPTCCGSTMSIDNPEDRAIATAEAHS